MIKQQPNKSNLKNLGYIGLIIVCIAYLLNPTGGFVEIIPDALPLVGNLDEATIASLLVLSIQKLREKPKELEDLNTIKLHELPKEQPSRRG